jgi:3-deoxy-D-manno-octulosonic-acid transferase
MLRFIYDILVCFAAPLATSIAWLRGVRDSTRRERLADRWGRPLFPNPLSSAAPTIWLHAASMGEVQAGASLVKQLLATYPQHRLVMTTMTTTGTARVRALFGDRVTHCYLPYDLPFAVNEFLNRVQPRLFINLETELWPNLLLACNRRRIPVLIASARISPRTAHRYRRLASLFREALAQVTVFAQTELDAERFRALGATQVSVGGNLKFDIDIAAATYRNGDELRELFSHRPCWVAGSTHEGEDQAALQAHRELCQIQPNALLIIVPRHPQRFATVEKLLQAERINYVTRSSNAAPTNAAVWLIDTMGELMNCYAACDVAFVGGTLVPVGGHSLLEPAALCKPIICGPYCSNAQDIFDLFTEQAALRCVANAKELGQAVVELMSSSDVRNEQGTRGKHIVDANGGALTRTLSCIADLLQT